MYIVVINGTPVKGVTYHMKEWFLDDLGRGNQIKEFYPKDLPEFCVGCKNCFFKGEEYCPHFEKTAPIWEAMLAADLIVFAYPTYALRAPASIKSLLDHLCVHWMVHRPEPKLFEKTAVIITNSVGAPNGPAQKDVKTSLTWMGVSKIHTCGAGMMGDIFADKMSQKHRDMLCGKMKKLAKKAARAKPFKGMALKVSLLFAVCKLQHKMVLDGEKTPGLDSVYYLEMGWIKEKRKRKG